MRPPTSRAGPTRPARRLAAALAVAPAAVLVGSLAVLGASASEAVRVVDNAFEPRSVTVEVGESVTWSWTGSNPHSVAGGPWGSSHPGCSPASTVACGGNGTTFTWTPEEAGRVTYSCEVHAGMTGTVEVLGRSPSPSPTPSRSPSSEPTPTEEPSSEPTPTEEPSSGPSSEPSSGPSSEPSPGPGGTEPTPSSSPTPRPTATSMAGPPPPRATEPPVVVAPSSTAPARPTPRPEVTLEAFPAAPDPDEVVASERDREALTDPGPADRTTAAVVALGLVLGTAVALVQFVLLGPPWPVGERDEADDGPGPDPAG